MDTLRTYSADHENNQRIMFEAVKVKFATVIITLSPNLDMITSNKLYKGFLVSLVNFI